MFPYKPSVKFGYGLSLCHPISFYYEPKFKCYFQNGLTPIPATKFVDELLVYIPYVSTMALQSHTV